MWAATSRCWGSWALVPGPAGAAQRTEGWSAPSPSQLRRAPWPRQQSQQPPGSCVSGEILMGKKRRVFPIDFRAFGLKLTLIFMGLPVCSRPSELTQRTHWSEHRGCHGSDTSGAQDRLWKTQP